MSGIATGWALKHGPKDRALRLVLVAIADAANRDGEHSHPGIDAIVDASCYSRRHVHRALRQLEDEGWIVATQSGVGRGHATTYDIPGVLTGPPLSTARNGWAPEKVTSRHPSSDSPELNGDISDKERCHLDVTLSSEGTAPIPLISKTNRKNNGNHSTELVAVGNESDAKKAVELKGDVDRLCHLLADGLAERGSKRPRVTERWMTDMDRLVRLDSHGVRDIERVIRWLQTGSDRVASFWRPNVRSPDALRRHWDRMAEQFKALKTAAATQPGPSLEDRIAARYERLKGVVGE